LQNGRLRKTARSNSVQIQPVNIPNPRVAGQVVVVYPGGLDRLRNPAGSPFVYLGVPVGKRKAARAAMVTGRNITLETGLIGCGAESAIVYAILALIQKDKGQGGRDYAGKLLVGRVFASALGIRKRILARIGSRP
jgi:hypothetical protein